ncbi:hypothetical protein [Litchfieldella xinjiangensis]|uniref:hypothetical protein n=1 Tax=Litchfieldella xinjiangensis TaxID=1166948 RepID=UPI0012E0B223|nr:hypothetical protein [Halomonas xinjiangensis]
MKLIQSGKYSHVYYDEAEDCFVKTFHPKIYDKLRYALGVKNHPGINFQVVANHLQQMGIATPEIIEAKKYRLVTRNVHGVPLKQEILGSHQLQDRFVAILVSLYNHGLLSRGLHTKNFLVSNQIVVAIDLDTYKLPSRFSNYRNEFIDCLGRSLKGDEAFLFERFISKVK